VVIAEGDVGGQRVTLAAFDFYFLGGSMGEATGERIVTAFAHALERRQPFVSLVATGGARIQEGMLSLRQIQRLADCVVRFRQARLPHVAAVLGPTTGGVWISLVTGADVIIGAEEATAAFAGERVRGVDRTGAGEAFSVGGKFRNGFIDVAVPAGELAGLVGRYAALLGSAGGHAQPPPLPCHPAGETLITSGWTAVQRARAPERPHALDYLSSYFEERVPISGDRTGGRDAGMLCGLGRRGEETIAYVAQTGTANSPAGFRTAARALRLADRLRIPVLTLIDTPGAQHDEAAEAGGIGHAIGDTFTAMAETSVPVTSVVIGEGGSGGALALAKAGSLWAAPDSYFSVIAPEAAASIVYRDQARAPEVAEYLHLGPLDLVEMGIASGIIPAG
jgi:acetyl-CoA carboxylase carboxyl transferase subunit beta